MKQKIKTILFWFILLQPFLDLYWFYNGPLANATTFTLPTIIRILAVGVLIGLFLSQKPWHTLTKQKWLLVYLILLIIYSALHLTHAINFTSVSPTSYNYSTISEIFYLVRMSLPLIIIYFTNYVTFSQKQFKQVISGLSFLFSGTIVITNLLIISLKSYETGFINSNIFAWFLKSDIGYSHMASKGFFNSANMLSAILFMLLPLMIYYLFTEFNWKIIILNILQSLAMIELGTKVAAIGLIGGIIIGLIIYLIHRYLIKNIKPKKGGWAFLTVCFLGIGASIILPFGPAIQRYNYEIYLAQKSDNDLSKEKKELSIGLKKYPKGKERTSFLKKFIKKNYPAYAINKKFILKSYPYQNDPEFWLKIMNEPGQIRMKNRNLEKAMLDQVIKTNNQPLDKVLGISYTRENNIFNLERDFVSQSYSLGWLGMLLFVGPFLFILFYSLIKWLFNKKVRTYLISSMIAADIFVLLAAFSSGNVIDFLTASFILAFLDGNLLVQIKRVSIKSLFC